MEMNFAEKCDNVICTLYGEVGEDGTRLITGSSLAEQLGLNTGEFMTIAAHLEGEGYIKYNPASGGGVVAITGKGIMYAQDKCEK